MVKLLKFQEICQKSPILTSSGNGWDAAHEYFLLLKIFHILRGFLFLKCNVAVNYSAKYFMWAEIQYSLISLNVGTLDEAEALA
jgi:hypothetical protein